MFCFYDPIRLSSSYGTTMITLLTGLLIVRCSWGLVFMKMLQQHEQSTAAPHTLLRVLCLVLVAKILRLHWAQIKCLNVHERIWRIDGLWGFTAMFGETIRRLSIGKKGIGGKSDPTRGTRMIEFVYRGWAILGERTNLVWTYFSLTFCTSRSAMGKGNLFFMVVILYDLCISSNYI